MQELWNRNSRIVNGESISYVTTDEAALLFCAEKVLRVYNRVTGETYEAGVDYVHEPGTSVIRRLPGGKMPYISAEKARPSKENAICYPEKGCNAISGALDGGFLIFDNASFFASVQPAVDYKAAAIDLDFPAAAPGKLPRFREKIGRKEAISITFLGDSITDGFNATKFTNSEPFQPCYAELVAGELEAVTGVPSDWKNRGVNGASIGRGIYASEEWIQDKPDILSIAYGMNDYRTMTAQEFIGYIDQIVELARRASPNTEIVLVSSMSGHPNWVYTPSGADQEFTKALHDYAGDKAHIVVADVNRFWHLMRERKNFYDLTGNGVNHPNDFGHRAYASVILAALGIKCG